MGDTISSISIVGAGNKLEWWKIEFIYFLYKNILEKKILIMILLKNHKTKKKIIIITFFNEFTKLNTTNWFKVVKKNYLYKENNLFCLLLSNKI